MHKFCDIVSAWIVACIDMRQRRAELHRAVASPGRRSFLRITASSLIMPLGAMAPASWRTDRPALDTLKHPPICRVAAAAPPVFGLELLLNYNQNRANPGSGRAGQSGLDSTASRSAAQ